MSGEERENFLREEEKNSPEIEIREAPGEAKETTEAPGEAKVTEEAKVALELKEVREALAAKTAEAKELLDKLKRSYADLDNFRKRWRREQEELTKFASEKLVCALLPVLDSFENALKAQDEGKETPFFKGVEMIYRQLEEVLKKEGLTSLNPMGEPFDPYYHEALMMVDTEDYPPQTVVEVLRKGYALNQKVIRPALVKVSTRKVVPFYPEKEGKAEQPAEEKGE